MEEPRPPRGTRRRPSPRFIAASGVLIGLALILAGWLAGNPVVPDDVAPGAARGASSVGAETARTEGTTTKAIAASDPAAAAPTPLRSAETALPLPATDLPLAATIDELERRAQGGDARAACRLAAEMEICLDRTLRFQSETSDDVLVEVLAQIAVPERQRQQMVAGSLQLRTDAGRMRARCEGIPAERMRDWRRWQLQAAQAGDTAAAVAFVRAALVPDGRALLAHPVDAQRLHDHVAPLLLALLEAGDANALRLLSLASAQEPPPDFLPAELLDPVVMAELARRTGLQVGDADDAAPTASAEAVARADALFERYFAHSPRWPATTAAFAQADDPAAPNLERMRERLERCAGER